MRILSYILLCVITFTLACLGYGCVAQSQTISGQDRIYGGPLITTVPGELVSSWPVGNSFYSCPPISMDKSYWQTITICPSTAATIINPPSDAEINAAMGYCRLKGDFYSVDARTGGHYDWGQEWSACYRISNAYDALTGRDYVNAIAARLP